MAQKPETSSFRFRFLARGFDAIIHFFGQLYCSPEKPHRKLKNRLQKKVSQDLTIVSKPLGCSRHSNSEGCRAGEFVWVTVAVCESQLSMCRVSVRC